MKNLNEFRIIDIYDTGFFNGVAFPQKMKHFELKMNKFDVNSSVEISKFSDLETLCYHTN